MREKPLRSGSLSSLGRIWRGGERREGGWEEQAEPGGENPDEAEIYILCPLGGQVYSNV